MTELTSTNDQSSVSARQSDASDNDYLKLRKLLLGPDYEQAIHDYIGREDDLERVSDVLPEAIKLCTKDKSSLGRALAPVLNKAIHESITNNPTQITNAISPIMGPAIRKAVSDALRDMVQNLNRVLEQSLSAQGLSWRFKAWRAGVSYGRYVMFRTQRFAVEQVLLVHRETGLLLHSVADEQANAKDPELVSSMLTAIQDFVSDSFETQTESSLDRVQMGDLTLHLMAGPYSVLAFAARGTVSAQGMDEVSDIFDSIQRRYSAEMEAFEGDREAFLSTEDDLRACLISEKIEPEEKKLKKPWLSIIVLSALALYLCFEGLVAYQIDRERKAVLAAISEESGYMLISHDMQGKTLHLSLLHSPDAPKLSTFSQQLNLQYLHLKTQAQKVTFGYVDVDKLNKLSVAQAPAPKTIYERYAELVASIHSTYLFFEEKSSVLSASSAEQLSGLVSELKQAAELAQKIDPGKLQIMVMGFADLNGSKFGNLQVSKRRAELVRSILVENGLLEESIVAWGMGYRDIAVSEGGTQRRVSIQLLLPGYEKGVSHLNTMDTGVKE